MKKNKLYLDEYNNINTKEEFISVISNKYKHLKISSIERIWRKFKSQYPKVFVQSQQYYQTHEKKVVDIFKLIQIDDMKKYKINITREYLIKHGFTNTEINWLIDNNIIHKI